jgi:galactitol-specific phosphotransferase system IIB component
MRTAVSASLILAAMLTMLVGVAGQGHSSPPAKAAPASSSAITHAIEERFRQLDAKADMKLVSVAVTAGRQGQSMLAVTATPPAGRTLDVHAQTIYALVFESLAQVPGGFASVSRIKLSLVRAPKGLTADCPMKVVQDSLGYMTLETLRGKCIVR